MSTPEFRDVVPLLPAGSAPSRSDIDDPKSHLLCERRCLETWRNVPGADTYGCPDVPGRGQSFEGDQIQRVTMDQMAHVPSQLAERHKPDAGRKDNELGCDS